VFWSVDEIRARLDDTTEGWRTWSQLHQSYDGPWRDLVQLSGRVLYALTYYPSGAICAAATTSLPEIVGGERNWDYRYAWVRDTSFTLQALWVAACPDEAGKYFDFIAGAAGMQLRRGVDLSIMFGLRGERDVTEHTLPHLRGWRDSAPVRVGNNAWMQRQLDVYGEVLDAACRLPDQVDRLSPSTRQFLRDCADTAAARWREPDRGIWEIRSEPRDFVYSKLMCWVALDRAIALADRLGATDRVAQWKDVREEIADAILRDGWSEKAGSFVQAFGSNALDASLLMMPIVGFLPANDPRVRATIDAIATRLTDERGLVYRYRTDDGLVGDESPFLLCTFHLAHALALAGEVERATQVFESAIAFANDLGLLSEEVDTNSGELLGNFPQALSHIGLVNAAWAISEAQPSSASPSS
jgi:alpha,alpha-trehalase